MDAQQVYNKLEKIEDKLDSYLERIAVVEEKQKNTAGHIRVLLGLIISAISSIIAYAVNQFTRNGGLH